MHLKSTGLSYQRLVYIRLYRSGSRADNIVESQEKNKKNSHVLPVPVEMN